MKSGACRLSTFARSKPGIDGVQPHQAARQQPGADEQHERRRELADDEQRAARGAARGCRSTRPPPPAIARTGSFMNVSRGAQAKSSAIAIETTSVKPSTQPSSAISPVRFVNRPVYAISRLRPATASTEAEHAAEDREHEVLGEQLPPQQRGRRAERGADAPSRARAARAASA